MKITSINLKRLTKQKYSGGGICLAVASIQLDRELVIHDLQLIQLPEKRIVKFPNKKKIIKRLNFHKTGYEEVWGFSDIVHPCTPEFRRYVTEELYKVYDKEEVK